ncbi:DNA repair protein RecO [Mucilaginibacter sp. KACC 22063]|uniref:DNA repair protein RecO n=1 Tax=Mucilaginibacter sp. KACC 22063 TaxID=3025666 RepID=UPI002366DCF8|nr:DNA repair protein RecO [Mucilaginibacter sp. KACC 22063]WDF54977.1 DNA repair protein RecO [Mucilaginibacter sp. KACC 22063]
MLQKTRGIVFKVTDYQESSVIVQVFTEKFGMQSYIINGVKKPKAKISRNILQPLHLLDMVVYNNGSGAIQRVKELKSQPILQTIPYDIIKSSLIIFLNEVLYKAIKQQSGDEYLFNYIWHSVEWLDQSDGNLSNFHLIFLLGLTRYLGFYPHVNSPEHDYFDLKDGVFARYRPESLHYLSAPHSHNFYRLLQSSFDNMQHLRLPNDERRYLIGKLMDYYALHIEGFGNIRSNEILEEVLG